MGLSDSKFVQTKFVYTKQNRQRFVSGVDFFHVKPSDFQKDEIRRAFGVSNTQSQVTLITETGYLMLVKSFNDDLAWKVQRQLVKSYFTVKKIKEDKPSHKENFISSTYKFLAKDKWAWLNHCPS